MQSEKQREPHRFASLYGLLAVATFAATLPLTRIALEGFAPLPLTFGRLFGAGVAALLCLLLLGLRPPTRAQLAPLLLVSLGGVFGFPLFTAWALEHHPAAPAAIPLALLPLLTALWARLRGHEHPSRRFWFWSLLGSGLVLHFVWRDGAGQVDPRLLAAAVSAAIAYAEGGRLARQMPGWRVMAWALVFALPFSALSFGYSWGPLLLPESAAPWAALAFLALVSQFGAFWLWYRALAAGVARASQIQLLQPLLTLLLAGLMLGEQVEVGLWLYAALVVVSIWQARRAASAPHAGQSTRLPLANAPSSP